MSPSQLVHNLIFRVLDREHCHPILISHCILKDSRMSPAPAPTGTKLRLIHDHNLGITRLFGFKFFTSRYHTQLKPLQVLITAECTYLRRTTPGSKLICYNGSNSSACVICFRLPPTRNSAEKAVSISRITPFDVISMQHRLRCAMYLTCLAGNIACCMAGMSNKAPGCL
ncbi:hypothetical protein BDW75DRAFT_48460 [Aspergillus navahoensis]